MNDEHQIANLFRHGTRREFLGGLTAAGAAAFVAGCGGSSSGGSGSSKAAAVPKKVHGGDLNIYTWPDYFATKNLAKFQHETAIKIRLSTYSDNGVLFNKLNSPAGVGYDIAIPTSGWVPEMVSKGLLLKLDHSEIPFNTIDPNLLNKNYDPHNQYSIPKDWGVMGVVYDPAAVGGTIKTWSDFLNAGAKPGVTGKVGLSSSGWETIGAAIWAEGGDWNTTDVSVIQRGGAVMKDFAKNVKTFNTYDPNSMANGTLVLSQCNQSTARSAILLNSKLKFVVPGPTSELWVDNYVIPKSAPDVDQAYAFLRFQLQPKIQVTDTEFIGFPTAVKNLQKLLPASTKQRALIFGGSQVDLSKLTTFIVNPKTIQVYDQLQNEIQAAA
jgi:spermidine/putrescine transport system substrate-binding protein